MSQTFRFLFLLAIVGIGLPGCFLFGGDDDQPAPEPIPPIDQLPPITSEGKGTFGCLVNGEVFIIENSSDAFVDYTIEPYFTLYANGRNPSRLLDIGLYDYNREEGYIQLPDSSATYTLYGTDSKCFYDLPDFQEGWIDIHEFNSFEDYVSGTFELTLVNDKCDTLRVTNGRFDIRVRR